MRAQTQKLEEEEEEEEEEEDPREGLLMAGLLVARLLMDWLGGGVLGVQRRRRGGGRRKSALHSELSIRLLHTFGIQITAALSSSSVAPVPRYRRRCRVLILR